MQTSVQVVIKYISDTVEREKSPNHKLCYRRAAMAKRAAIAALAPLTVVDTAPLPVP